MNEIEFRNWMIKKDINKKVQSDTISRLKRVEREINHCDIDEEYRSDRCKYLINLFSNNGKNDEMLKIASSSLPIGKYYMSTYRHAIKIYIDFSDEINNVNHL